LVVALEIGGAVAVVVAVSGGVRAIRGKRTGGALDEPATARRYGIVVGVEFAVGGVGAGVLSAAGGARFVPVWICAVVGLHFFPLASVLRAPLCRGLGMAVLSVAAAALLVGVFSDVPPSTVTGTGAGAALLGYSILMLVGPHRSGASSIAVPEPPVVP
jgi:hypothetical protein